MATQEPQDRCLVPTVQFLKPRPYISRWAHAPDMVIMGTTIVHTLPELAPRGFNDTLAQGICEKCLHPMYAHVDHQDTICQFLTYTFHDCADSYCVLS